MYAAEFAGAQRNIAEARHRHRADLLIRILHGEHVVVSAARIDPVTRRDDAVRSQRGDHVVDDFFRRQPELARLLAIDVELEAGIVEVLRNQDVAHAARAAQFLRDLFGDLVRFVRIVVAHLDIERRGQSLIHDRIDEAAGLKISAQLRQIGAQPPPHAVHVFVAADAVLFFQAHLHERRVHSRIRRVDRGKIGRDADIRDDHAEIGGRDDFADFVFDLRDQFVGDFEPRSARRFYVDHELPGIGARKVRRADKREKSDQHDRDSGEEDSGRALRPFERLRHGLFVIDQHLQEKFVEALHDVREPAFFLALRRALRCGRCE